MPLHAIFCSSLANLVGNGALALLEHPAQLAKLRGNANFVPNAVKEILRYDPPIARLGRIAIEPLLIGETQIEADEAIEASLTCSGTRCRLAIPTQVASM